MFASILTLGVRCLPALVSALLFAPACIAAPPATPAELVGQPAPLFTGKTIDGKVVSLEELRGRVVVLEFWASWCPDCRDALPKMAAVARRFESSAVTILGFNTDKDMTAERLAQFLQSYGVAFGQILDPEGFVKKKYLVRRIPTVFVLDKQGTVRFVHVEDVDHLETALGDAVASQL